MTLVVFVILCKICVRFLLLASSGGFLLPGAQRGFFTAERGGRRQFQLAVPCQPGRFRPHASYLRKEARCRASAKKLPKGTPLKGGSSGLFPKQRDRGPSGTPGLPGIEYSLVERCYVLLSALWSGVRQICKTRLGAKQISSGNFFARGLLFPTAAGTPSPPQSPRKDFCRAKMPCGGERLPNLLLGSLIVVRTANRVAIAIQNESTNKKP